MVEFGNKIETKNGSCDQCFQSCEHVREVFDWIKLPGGLNPHLCDACIERIFGKDELFTIELYEM